MMACEIPVLAPAFLFMISFQVDIYNIQDKLHSKRGPGIGAKISYIFREIESGIKSNRWLYGENSAC